MRKEVYLEQKKRNAKAKARGKSKYSKGKQKAFKEGKESKQ